MENIQSTGLSFRLIFSCLAAAILLSCSQSEPATITIKGNLKYLPSGSVVLQMLDSDGWKTIDSVVAKGGIFEFNLPVAQYPEPVLVGISHYDTAGIKRPIISSTGTKGRAGYGGIEATSEFLLEDGIELAGP
uniref:DUF4369 domain-containing protein n=1 Tax=Persicitalea sp. TaxID=3100273 RepID=UPI003594417B